MRVLISYSHEDKRAVEKIVARLEGPLSVSRTYLSYDSLRELASQPNLSHLKESVLDDYEEGVEE